MSDGEISKAELLDRIESLEDKLEEKTKKIESLESELKDATGSARGAESAAVNAMNTAGDLEEHVERHEERISEVEAKVDPDPHMLQYQELDREQKVRMVREHLAMHARASASGGANITYRDVQFNVFGGEPSPHHCYDLMELAANADGYRMLDDPKRVAVRMDDVADPSLKEDNTTPGVVDGNKGRAEGGGL